MRGEVLGDYVKVKQGQGMRTLKGCNKGFGFCSKLFGKPVKVLLFCVC